MKLIFISTLVFFLLLATAVVSADSGARADFGCDGAIVQFDDGIPATWQVVSGTVSSDIVWTTTTTCGETANYTGGTGDAACASSDQQSLTGLYDTSLISPSFSLSGTVTAQLSYKANYQNYFGGDVLDLDTSIDGGTSWQTMLHWNEDHGAFRAVSGEPVTVTLTSLAGEHDVLLRWRYYDEQGPEDASDWYVQIDDIALTCENSAPTAVKLSGQTMAILQDRAISTTIFVSLLALLVGWGSWRFINNTRYLSARRDTIAPDYSCSTANLLQESVQEN